MKVLVADDHSIVREGLKHYIDTLPNVEIIDEAGTGTEAWNMISNHEYDVVVLDVSMPGMSGIEVLQKIKEKNLRTNVLILSVHSHEQYAVHAYKLGALGYISKESPLEEVRTAIRKVASGGRYITSSFAERMAFNILEPGEKKLHEQLSKRELQVMLMLSRGKSVTEIAKEIFISGKTVSTYRSRILVKMGMKKNADMTIYSIRNNLIE
jgi:DNA-binding NarL/FixJ family response regulator